MALTTAQDLDNAGVPYTSAEQASQLIAHIEGLISIECPNLSLTAEAETTVAVRGSWRDTLALPKRPVLSVSEVSIDGVQVATFGHSKRALLRLGASGGHTWPSAMSDSAQPNWGGPNSTVTATYRHGLTTAAQAAVVGLITQAIGRHLASPAGVRQESFGASSVSYSGGPDGLGGLGLSSADRRTLRQLER